MLNLLISTMDDSYLQNPSFKKLGPDCVTTVVNQTKKGLNSNTSNAFNYQELGLARSRNRAIQHSVGDILLFCDDDVEFLPGFDGLILEAFKRIPEADIITFQMQKSDSSLYRNYPKSQGEHSSISLLGVSSVEIAVRKSSLDKVPIQFDERFGLGARFPTGEENIWLFDARRKGFRIFHSPTSILIHPEVPSGLITGRPEQLVAKGAVLARIFGSQAWLWIAAFTIKNARRYREHFSPLQVFRLLNQGAREFFALDERVR